MKRCYFLAIGLFVLSACSRSDQAETRSLIDRSYDVPAPRPPADVPQMATEVMLLGEMHGTQNAPAFWVETIRAIESRPIAVGFEAPQSLQGHVDAFLKSDGSDAAQRDLLSQGFWTTHDGRSSEAFFDALVLLRKLRLTDPTIEVFLFDSPGRDRERAMADAIIAQARKTKTVVLTGNVHARTKIGAPWDPKFKPMGWYIAQSVAVQSFNINGADGEAWFCLDRRCGVHRLAGTAAANSWGYHLFDQIDERGFSGEFRVGTYRASHPKVAEESVVQ